MLNRFWAGCLIVALAGCEGVIGAGGFANDDGPTPQGEPQCGRSVCGATGELAAATAFPRLTHTQWENSVRDLLRLGATPGLAGSFEPDTRISFFDNNIRALRVSGDLWGDYQGAAETLAEAIVGDPETLARVLPAGLPSDPGERARSFIAELGRRAYRRPLSTEEVDAHAELFDTGASHFPELNAFDAGVRIVLEAVLQSPYFVYRVETGVGRNGDAIQLSDFEVASRLSYVLWNTMPDDALFEEAASGRLSTADQVAAQAARMLEDARGQAMVERFHSQLFNWDLYRGLSVDPSEFPLYYPDVGDDMVEEARRFVEHVVFSEEGSLADLLTAPYTFVNDGLAPLYGFEGSFDDSFSMASFDGADQSDRGGLLTQVGFLASHGGLTGAIHRGVFINHRVLCTELPPPPDALPPIPSDDGMTLTSRERIEMHTGPGTCGSTCHGTYINPIGFAFESYDALGQYRVEESGLPIDASAEFEFADGPAEFDGALELNDAMASRIETHDCYTKHWLEYALGRDTAGADLDIIQGLGDQSLAGASVKELILELVKSEAFRTRNAEGT